VLCGRREGPRGFLERGAFRRNDEGPLWIVDADLGDRVEFLKAGVLGGASPHVSHQDERSDGFRQIELGLGIDRERHVEFADQEYILLLVVLGSGLFGQPLPFVFGGFFGRRPLGDFLGPELGFDFVVDAMDGRLEQGLIDQVGLGW